MGPKGNFLFQTVILFIFLYLLVPGVLTSKLGEEVKGVVTALPGNCSTKRSNYITVVYDNHSYEVRIDRSDCEAGTYSEGKIITLQYFGPFNHLQTIDESRWFMQMIILVVVAAFYAYCVMKFIQSQKRKRLNG